MNTTAECYQALLDGKKLQQNNMNMSQYIYIKNGWVLDQDGFAATYSFCLPEDWSIYSPPKWYENIPEGGVLCWVSSDVARITEYRDELFSSGEREASWESVIPLTKEEIQVFMDNAPEDL